MRCNLAIAALLVAGCATPTASGRVCEPIQSWGAPAFHCEPPPPPPPPPAPAPPPPPPEPEPPKKVEIKADTIELKETIEFELASTKLLDKSTPILDDVVKVMQDHPEILKVEVQGHTDNQGGHAYNVKLSAGRAASVRKYLVDHGIDAGRIVSKGYGPDKPIGDNTSEDGRAQNRRVEIHILDRKQ
jgi:OOP family OmpA-OmpF porin